MKVMGTLRSTHEVTGILNQVVHKVNIDTMFIIINLLLHHCKNNWEKIS